MIFQCHMSTLIWICCHLYTWILHLVTCVALFLGSILFRGCLTNGLIINIITCVILNNIITIIMIIMIIISFPWRGSWSSNVIWALRTKSLPDQPLDLAFGDMRLSVFVISIIACITMIIIIIWLLSHGERFMIFQCHLSTSI